ncbi:MAG: 50S ribosome-binding GTPase [Halioglobus sp.]|jgi:uncharacterized protein (DUF697 family)/GTP-binding protein EngB required for normal cell division
MRKLASKIYDYVINPPTDEDLVKAWQLSDNEPPTLWLLGKTGAGKSTIIQKLTGHSSAEIGNGFMPCTKTSSYFDYPQEHPILRFLDTKGLGEVEYNADDDLSSLSQTSHALFVVARVRDSEQSAVEEALRKIRKSARHIQKNAIAIVHTGALEIADEHDRKRAVNANQARFETAWGSSIEATMTDFSPQAESGELDDYGFDALKELIDRKIPELSLWLSDYDHDNAEQENFNKLKADVLWYAATAAASDAVPFVGLVSVPAVQGKMLHSLAQKYGIVWSRANYSEFIAALGTSFAVRYAVSLGARQLGKLIPAYGQIAGTAFSVTVSYSSTYAIGRAACSYLYHKKTNTPFGEESLSSVYEQAISEGNSVGKEIARDLKE